MYAADYSATYGPSGAQHRFNPNAPAFRIGGPTAYAGYGVPMEGHYAADSYGMPPMNPSLLAAEQPTYPVPHAYNPPSNEAHQTSFGSSNTSFSGPSSPAVAGAATSSTTKRSRYTHNPYASSNASNSEPNTPTVQPAIASTRVPADAAFFSSMSSAQGSSVQSPVYAPEGQYGDASTHPIAFSINEQFAQARGNLAAAACTPRGRHMLVGALRQQHTDKIQAIFEELAPNVAAIIMDPQGGHVIRTLIEFLNEPQIAGMVQYLTPEVVLTIATSSQNTRRVLQSLFERHRTPALQPVVTIIATHAIALATTQQGCIAVMRCLEHTVDLQKLEILGALTPQLAALTMDPYGNYVVQAILQYFEREVACEVIEKAFNGHWVQLSCNKFASNVMEKFIQAATPMTRKTILEELVYNSDGLNVLMSDGFGNFVLQQIIDTCTTGPEYRKLAEKVRPLLGTSPFGHKIEAKLKSKRFGPPYEAGASSTGTSTGATAPREGGGRSSTGRGPRRSGGGTGEKENESTVGKGSRGARIGPKESSGADTTSRSASNMSSSSQPVNA